MLVILISSTLAWASLYTDHLQTEDFSFRAKNQIFTISATAESREKAFEIAAFECMDLMAARFGDQTEEKRLDIIDVCANPVR